MIKRIAIIGPESSGKTKLCSELAIAFQTVWVPEYAREYLESISRTYTFQDIEHISKTQLQLEKEAIKKANQFIFSDTELIISKIWCQDVFHSTPQWMDVEIRSNPYDLYLLTTPDLPWIYDPLRENEKRRDHFFKLYHYELTSQVLTFEVVSGKGKNRLQNAIGAIKKHFG